MDHVLVSVLMDLLLGLLCRAVMFSAGELLSGTWAGSCRGGWWLERAAPLFVVYNTKVKVRDLMH